MKGCDCTVTRKEKVLSYIKSKEYVPLKISELMMVLDVPEKDGTELLQVLTELIDEGRIVKTKRGRYEPVKDGKIVCGTLSCSMHGFFAFLIPDEGEEKVYIKGEYIAGALHGDYVSAVVDNENTAKKCREGRVLKILKHVNENICGVVKKKRNNYYEICADSGRLYTNIRVNEENISGASVGERVIVKVIEYKEFETIGTVIKILGRAEDVKSSIDSILFSENISVDFSEEAIEEVKNIPEEVSEKEIENRLDLRDELIFTIDGDDARDFDDAVSIKRIKNNEYRLGVHIADVTHYVKEHTALDREAFQRGTSVYFPGRVIPMLPEKLSNGICSLNPGAERLTLSVFMEFDDTGRLLTNEICKSVIRSCERMTYDNVTDLLTNPTDEQLKRYKRLLPVLRDMEELAKKLKNKRMERGSIDFDFPETKIVVDDSGIPKDILPEKRGISNKIIEEFMLAANETVAEYAFWSEIPFIYRVHEPPSTENMRDFARFITAFGINMKERFNDDEPIHSKTLQQVLNEASGKDEEHMISVYALRSLMKAEYKHENLGHFGLAAKYYCHFTSPIRRYPDLIVHRILKNFIDGKATAYAEFTAEIAKKSSEAERKAQVAERSVDDFMKTYYMSQYVGYVYEAKISSITDFGIFAELDNTVEGFIRLEFFKDDFYEFDSEKRILCGRRSGRIYKIGDKIEIAVAQCNFLTHQIDFIPAEGADMSDIEKIRQNTFKNQRERNKKIKVAAAGKRTTKKRRYRKNKRG